MAQNIDTTADNGNQAVVSNLYPLLTARFDSTYEKNGFTYVSGEQVVTRLNEALGVFGWNFEVLSHLHDLDADEIIVQGRLRAYDENSGQWVTRDQWGSQKINRRKDGSILELGFDYKGATTDCLKKCATLLGVALYLSAKDEAGPPQAREVSQQNSATARNKPIAPKAAALPSASAGSPTEPGKFTCAECGAELTKVSFKNGDAWEAFQLANNGLAKFKRVLCMTHYRAALDSSKASAS